MTPEERRIQIVLEEAARAKVEHGGPLEVHLSLTERDDCAVLALSPDMDLVIGSDFVRGTGFYLFEEGLIDYEDIGRYLVAANVSDIAAMGARPSGIVAALRYSKSLGEEEWRLLLRGICTACREFGIALLGGDSGSYCADVLSAAAIGTVKRGQALIRSNGLPGDKIYITGTVGTAGAAVAYFCRGRYEGGSVSQSTEKRLLDSWRKVTPAIEQSCWLTNHGYSRCGIDTSDGLKAALIEIANRSKVDVVLIPDAVPVDPVVREVSKIMSIDSMEIAMSDSVDFRLLFTVAPKNQKNIEKGFLEHGWPLHEVGFIRESSKAPKVVSLEADGENEVVGQIWDQSDTATFDRLSKKD